mgnify:CR=1 FL=1
MTRGHVGVGDYMPQRGRDFTSRAREGSPLKTV